MQSLLSQATDSQGRTTPQAVLALLNVAAQNQAQGADQSLQDLASHLQLSSSAQTGGASRPTRPGRRC